ncbi:MAG: hypothetical protein QOC99_385 [Acidobacteriota bacterium]|jgi:ABC-type amino acid transport substrate-binding protein|nr:hypothetical protein [Acidobacteriota bacterium]
MDTGTKRAIIRVVKRQQRDLHTQAPSLSPSRAKEGCTDRDLAAAVNSWIDEFRRRRQVETAALFDKFFKVTLANEAPF